MLLTNPKTKRQDVIYTLTALATLAAITKFMFEGVEFTVLGQTFNLGHADPLTYGAFLAPILGAHGYTQARDTNGDGIIDERDKQ